MKDVLNHFYWLIKFNETLTGMQLAARIEAYSSHPKALYMASVARRAYWFERTHTATGYSCAPNWSHKFGSWSHD